jgi:nucleoside-diphosphate-sugar epimerase
MRDRRGSTTKASSLPSSRMRTVTQRKVLLTGAEGTIGSAVRRKLSRRYKLIPITRTEQNFPSFVADIADLAAIEPAFAGVDAVVHLAGASAVKAEWEDVLRDNIIGTYNVFEAASRAGAERVVFASSNHVIGMYEVDHAPQLYDLGDVRTYDHRVEIRPDSPYAVSKVFGEALGRYYVERRGLRVFCLRIGSVSDEEDSAMRTKLSSAPAGPGTVARARMRAVWLSKRDCAHLIERCLEVEDVRWAVVYGTSNNPRQFLDLSHARAVLGYSPRDGAPI